MITSIQLAYVAGWCDGESSFGLNKQYRTGMKIGFDYTPKITLTNTDIRPIEFALRVFNLHNKILPSKPQIGHKQKYQVHICKMRDVIRVCCLLEPYLITKKQECLLLKQFCIKRLQNTKKFNVKRAKNGTFISFGGFPQYDDLDHQIFVELRQLKIKGKNRGGDIK
jgi:hypothetical protein